MLTWSCRCNLANWNKPEFSLKNCQKLLTFFCSCSSLSIVHRAHYRNNCLTPIHHLLGLWCYLYSDHQSYGHQQRCSVEELNMTYFCTDKIQHAQVSFNLFLLLLHTHLKLTFTFSNKAYHLVLQWLFRSQITQVVGGLLNSHYLSWGIHKNRRRS